MSAIIGKEPAPVAALVVGYMPDLAVLNALLLGLLAEVGRVVLLDNGGASGYLSELPGAHARVQYIDMGGNQGLGAALNRGMQEARSAGLRYVITFDQDSAPPPGMAAALLQALQAAQRDGTPCAAVGPVFHDQREAGQQCFPLYREAGGRIHAVRPQPDAGPQEVDMLITSGMLVDSDAWADGLRYEEGLIVDYTDTDWCFRARASGRRLLVLASQRMPHTLSDQAPVRLFGRHFLRYSAGRRYYYFRNTVYFLRQPYSRGPWRRRLLAGMVLRLAVNFIIDPQRLHGLRMSFTGIVHGLRGRLGRYPS